MSGLTWYLRTSITSGMDALRRSGPVVLRAAKRLSNAASVGANAGVLHVQIVLSHWSMYSYEGRAYTGAD